MKKINNVIVELKAIKQSIILCVMSFYLKGWELYIAIIAIIKYIYKLLKSVV